ncbi:MAG: hypothetical protein ACKVP2_00510 [Burkholderiales bacterium]
MGILASLTVEIVGSRILAGALIAVHAVSAGLALAYLQPLWLGILVVAILGGSLAFHLQRDVRLCAAGSILGLRFEESGRCLLRLRGGETLPGTVLPSSFSTPILNVLRVKTPVGSRSVVLFPDSASPDDLRRLRVWLRSPRALPKPPVPGQN